MALYPRIDPPQKMPDGTYIVRVYASATEMREVPAKDLKVARQTIQILNQSSELLLSKEARTVRPPGRPTKLTADLQAAFFAAVEVGGSIADACAANDIAYSTYKNWRHLGQEGAEPYASFLSGLKKHRARGRLHHWGKIYRGEPQWQASARALEACDRRFVRRTAEAIGQAISVAFVRPLGSAPPVSDTISEVVLDTPVEEAGKGGNGAKKRPRGGDQT